MAGEVQFINGVNIASGGSNLLNPLLTDLINQTNYMQDVENVQSEMLLTETRALSLTQKFSTLVGPVELDEIQENGLKPEQVRGKTPDKGFTIKEFGGEIKLSYLMRKWIEESGTIQGANPDVQQGWADFMQNGSFLLQGSLLNVRQEAIRLFEKGFSISTAYGPGSATPKGKALFAIDHPVRNNSLSFRNVLTTANQALSAASLQDALNIHKTELKLDNGYRVRLPQGAFELWVSRKLAYTARVILNTADNKAGIFSGVNSNANQLQTFNFQGNMVTIKEIPYLGDVDKNGSVIGSDTMWFVVNTDTMRNIKGTRMIKLYDPRIKSYENNATDELIADLRIGFAIEHTGAESAIVGSLGTV